MKSYKRVGIFDSGVGGLSVAKSVLESKLFESAVYFGDTARVPYGVKDEKTIVAFALECLEFFRAQEVDMLLVACNTVSAYALESMRSYASFPIIGVIEPGVLARINANPALDSSTLILGTQATITSARYQTLLQEAGFSKLSAVATGLFVPIVEEGSYRTPSGAPILQACLHHYLHPFLQAREFGGKAPDTIILGCTHFPLIAKEISAYFHHQSTLIHSGDAIVEYLVEHFELKPNTYGKTEIEFFASSDVNGLKKRAQIWLYDKEK